MTRVIEIPGRTKRYGRKPICPGATDGVPLPLG
jgi:hypothetical protein